MKGYQIALVKQDYTSSHDGIICDIFSATKNSCEYQLDSSNQQVFDNHVICEVTIKVLEEENVK